VTKQLGWVCLALITWTGSRFTLQRSAALKRSRYQIPPESVLLDHALGDNTARLRVLRSASGSAADVQFDRAESSLMPLDGHTQRCEQTLGRVEVHHDPLVRLDVLAAGRERLGIQAEVEDHLLGSRRYPAEVGVRRQSARIVNDDLGCRGLGCEAGVLSVSFSLISGSCHH